MVMGKKAAIGDSCEEVQGIYWKAGGIISSHTGAERRGEWEQGRVASGEELAGAAPTRPTGSQVALTAWVL